jgi:hypothetical protein
VLVREVFDRLAVFRTEAAAATEITASTVAAVARGLRDSRGVDTRGESILSATPIQINVRKMFTRANCSTLRQARAGGNNCVAAERDQR